MAEALFIETLRRYMEELPPEQTGWLAGARDPVVGGAWRCCTESPVIIGPWSNLPPRPALTLGSCREVLPVSRRAAADLSCALATATRSQDAANHAADPVMQVACDVGYESEAAFNRAFKREFGIPPGQFRRSCADRTARPRARRERISKRYRRDVWLFPRSPVRPFRSTSRSIPAASFRLHF